MVEREHLILRFVSNLITAVHRRGTKVGIVGLDHLVVEHLLVVCVLALLHLVLGEGGCLVTWKKMI